MTRYGQGWFVSKLVLKMVLGVRMDGSLQPVGLQPDGSLSVHIRSINDNIENSFKKRLFSKLDYQFLVEI
jgi:hypothetical protein